MTRVFVVQPYKCLALYCLCCRAVVADRDKLCLQESHLSNTHHDQLHPYYLQLVLQRLETAYNYVTPVELESEIIFFSRGAQ